jgi:hypothetical protein
MKQLKAGLLRSPGPLLLLPAQSQSAILRKRRINKKLINNCGSLDSLKDNPQLMENKIN